MYRRSHTAFGARTARRRLFCGVSARAADWARGETTGRPSRRQPHGWLQGAGGYEFALSGRRRAYLVARLAWKGWEAGEVQGAPLALRVERA